MSDEEFDVWFTFRFDGNVRYETRIDANPAGPGDMISALSEGNAEEIWALMERTLCYFPLHACQRALEEHAKEFLRIVESPSESTRAGADTGNSNFASAEASQSEPVSGGDVPCCESERPKEAEGQQRETHSSASEREAAFAGYIRYTSQPVIGTGAYGVVYRVRSRRTGEEFALKCHTHGAEDATMRELSCLAALRGHPNIIQLLDCFMDEGSTVAMLKPYVPYTLSRAIHAKIPNDRPGGMSPLTRPRSFVASFSSQTANALAYMHRLNLIHRDIAPNNLLLTEDLTVKVADLGLARQSSGRMSLSVVTEPYRAPELFAAGRTAEYICAIDVWSLVAVIATRWKARWSYCVWGSIPRSTCCGALARVSGSSGGKRDRGAQQKSAGAQPDELRARQEGRAVSWRLRPAKG
ncbi:hypothetical protein Q5P01_017877 [Channa striata]|uniref:Protein kinase domain-containing protein n=1 Tax=Channa striata TaxID=64152 RepID=A0AA88M495_CHASR|nr:hypothetical protein Q5P01_017877 [Channa striata]